MKAQILIIDDDIAVRDSLKKILQETGYAVVLAADGQQGVDCLNQQAFDLLILDLDLPKLNGFDVIDIAMEQFQSMPILVLTGRLDQCEPGALTHVDVVIEKPADVARLLRAVSSLIKEPHRAFARRLSLALMPPVTGGVFFCRPELPASKQPTPPGNFINQQE